MGLKYRIINIKTGAKKPKASVLIIYTGGTIGMIRDESGVLVALKFNQIMKQLPSLRALDVNLTVISFPVPIDSSNLDIQNWLDLGYIIYENYHHHDGFVVLQGTDTMAYSASALSYILEGLNKPVIFTGAQLPISAIRSDARPNLITAIEIAAMKKRGKAMVPEVCIYFDYLLLRGNRARKIRSNHFGAFESEDYPLLAKIGINIDFDESAIMRKDKDMKLRFHNRLDQNVAILKIIPSITADVIKSTLKTKGLKGALLETYGSGNAPNESWFINLLKSAIDRGIVIFNVTQCLGGKVIQGRYDTSRQLADIGVVGGSNITTEAAITKMMFLLAQETSIDTVKNRLEKAICGEMNGSE